MKWQGSHKMRTVWLGVMICVLTGGNITHADFVFGEPVNLGAAINSPGTDASPLVTPDGLQLYYGSDREGGLGGLDLWMSTRPTTDDDWGEPVNLGESFNTPDWDAGPSLSADGLDLYFARMVYEGDYPGDLWVAKRASTDAPWGEPINLGPTVNCMLFCFGPCIAPDGLSLFFYSDGSGTADVWMTTRPTLADSWGAPVNLEPPVNDESWDYWPHLAADGLALLFCSDRDGTEDVWMARRPSVSEAWGAPVKLGPPVSTEAWDTCPCVSADGRTLYFVSDRDGGQGSYDLWQAPITPIVDFNGDTSVDIEDLLTMIDNWGTSESLCDIGPMPWGDGIVDKADAEVLMSYLEQELARQEPEPGLVAHWKLDEAEGGIAYDTVGDNDGMLMGDPAWEPEGGMVGGALGFDGTDDCVETPYVLDAGVRPFSVFAWVLGGAPGEMIVCQDGGANWLVVRDDGVLATEPSGSGANDALISAAVITDGDWHRVGLTWDRPARMLYVDEVEVAADRPNSLGNQDTILYIGASGPSNRRRASTFFSGLIDDVRIYNRAVRP